MGSRHQVTHHTRDGGIINIIIMNTCNSTHQTSCFKRWYKVVGWGDYYYALGCSDLAAAGEVENMKGPSGKEGSFYCTGDFCNSSGAMGALMGLTVMAVLANLMK